MLVVACMFFPLLIMTLLFKTQHKLKTEYVKNTYGALYADIKTEYKTALFFNVIYTSRRIIFAGTALIGMNFPFC